VAVYLKANGQKSAYVGHFTGPPGIDLRLERAFSEHLKPRLEQVEANAWGVYGKYSGRLDDISGKYIIAIKVDVRDLAGNDRQGWERIISNEKEVLMLLGTTVELPLAAEPHSEPFHGTRALAIQHSLEQPSVLVSHNVVSASPASPFGVELLMFEEDSASYVPVPIEAIAGRAVASLAPDRIYALRLRNRAGFDAEAHVYIDGENALPFFAHDPAQSAILEDSHGSGTRQNSDRRDLNQTSNIAPMVENPNALGDADIIRIPAGQSRLLGGYRHPIWSITALFRASWPAESDPPADEPALAGEFPISHPAELPPEVTAARHVGVVRSGITIRHAR
jgi:hypothetical protein